MSLSRKDREKSTVEKSVAFGFTLVLHVFLIGIVIYSQQSEGKEPEEKPHVPEIIDVGQVLIPRKGNPRPENALPRINNAAPETVAEDVVNINENAKKEEKKEEKEKPKEKPKNTQKKKKTRNLDAVIDNSGVSDPNRPVTDDTGYGVPNGSDMGNTDGPGTGDPYIQDTMVAIKRAWRVPPMAPDKLARLKAVVRIVIDSGGRITSWEFVQKSGNADFDDSIGRTLDSFKSDGPNRLGKPPKKFALKKIPFGFEGKDLK